MDYHLTQLSGDILVGIVNEQLRLNCQDKQELFYQLDIPKEQLEQKLAASGFEYDPISNQYRACR
ncbi:MULTISPECIES: DUF4250 domain-containing protein [Shewanella]|uniref:DUF4250 domain-containing protein n=1 Tax=Shewanella marisflavi TaxID=260364 RepID=A0AAC9TYP9_9GAMM|nr:MULTISPECIES: DUF4250 domain-containing protein [Shewanella]ASJ96506.1 hypothetical protein CFF01_07835 [Shewanella marisflavi]MCL1041441.1 DUF4250 domain-containing protein [Shewanella marisflavi]QDF75037.1 DUF4250 domain-containing protein [Shewanella marisflavi]